MFVHVTCHIGQLIRAIRRGTVCHGCYGWSIVFECMQTRELCICSSTHRRSNYRADSDTVLHSLPEQVLNTIYTFNSWWSAALCMDQGRDFFVIICEVKLGWTCMEAWVPPACVGKLNFILKSRSPGPMHAFSYIDIMPCVACIGYLFSWAGTNDHWIEICLVGHMHSEILSERRHTSASWTKQ